MSPIFLLMWSLCAGAASETIEPPPEATEAEIKVENAIVRPAIEVNFRTRSMWFPAAIVDLSFFDKDTWDEYAASDDENAGDWNYERKRPAVHAKVFGIETVVRAPNAPTIGIFYLEIIRSTLEPGYWDDIENPTNHWDGDYIVPSKNFGFFVLGADYATEIPIIRAEQTGGEFGLSFLVGGGLGLGFMSGELKRWGQGQSGEPDAGEPGYTRFENGTAADGNKELPAVFPLLDINASLQFQIASRANLRLDAGLHTMLFWGASFGLLF